MNMMAMTASNTHASENVKFENAKYIAVHFTQKIGRTNQTRDDVSIDGRKRTKHSLRVRFLAGNLFCRSKSFLSRDGDNGGLIRDTILDPSWLHPADIV